MKRYDFIILLFFLLLTLSCVSANDTNHVYLVDDADADANSQLSEIENTNPIKNCNSDTKLESNVFEDNDASSADDRIFKATDIENIDFLTADSNSSNNENPSTLENRSSANSNSVISKVYSKDVTSTYGKTVKFNLKVVNNKGSPITNEPVSFKVNNKVYEKYTNSEGIATLDLNLNAGTYTIFYSVGEISGKNKYQVKNYYKIVTYKWKSGANVKKNKKIKSHIPNSKLVRKVVKAAKSGTPVIKFKGSKGKAVFITAGVHGNEISSQVAAMKLIQYLENHPINGTVYIMPFMNPKATAANVRDYKGVHLNKKADVKGTISYKTVKLITKFKCKAYGDFHCTRPGGKPGKDAAMGTYKPTAKSADLAKYIAKKSKVKYVIYKKAGVEYPGALEDTVSLKGIPSVTCEVITPHGKIAKGSVSKSLSMMKSFLKFSSLL